MKRKIIIMIAFIINLGFVNAQEKGVHFEHGLSWNDIKAKAKVENKYIFMDCFTTWCGPCKMMDQNIYTSGQVGDKLNDQFIAVKVQMDKTPADAEDVKKWYSDAVAINDEFKITAYPSYLFFSADGKLVHRDIGYKEVNDFITLLSNVSDPSKQYVTLLGNYKNGKRDYASMAYLANSARNFGDKDIANQIAKDYIENYLDKLSVDELCTKKHIDFFAEFSSLVNSRGHIFDLLYQQSEKADALAFKGWANNFVNYIVTREEITEKLWKNDKAVTNTPDWKKFLSAIHKKYPSIDAQLLVLNAQGDFYRRVENWTAYVNARNAKIKQYPPKPGEGLNGDPWILNSIAWDLFLSCNDKTALESALLWSDISIKLDDNIQFLDTRANLLYKLGRVQEGIDQEQKAIDVGIENAKKAGREKGDFFDDYTDIITKMKRGLPTWPVK